MPRRRSHLRRAGLLVLIGILAAGCAKQRIGLPSIRDVAGTCKLVTTAEEMITPSDVSPAVSCTGPHVYEVYVQASVPGPLAGQRRRPGPEALAAQAAAACPLEEIRPYLGATPLDSQWGISIWAKYPTETEWADGFRLVTCDLVVDSLSPSLLPEVSFPLHDVMQYTDSARVRLCRGSAATDYLTCNRPHLAELAGSVRPTKTHSAAALCAAQVHAYLEGALPVGDVVGTSSQGGAVDCWITSTHGAVTGTLRGGLKTR